MKAPTFRGKPSESHVIWRDGSGGGGEKTFDEAVLRTWCSAVGADYETDRRVDHGRGDEPREQYRCVFSWAEPDGESFAIGDDQWEIETGRTPRTFVEIDSRGVMRVGGRESERVVDVEELRVEGRTLVFRGSNVTGTKRLDASTLLPE